MAMISKFQMDQTIKHLHCGDVMHPWHPRCIPAIWIIFKASVIGINKFMLGMYLLDVMLRWNKLDKEEIKLMLQSYLRTGMVGLTLASTFLATNCFLRRINPYNYYTMVSLPAFLGGLGVFIETKRRTDLFLYSYTNMLIETVFKHLDYWNIWRLNAVNGTILFMLANGMVMYEIRKQRLRGMKPTLYWFFTPPSVQDCPNNNNIDCDSVKPWSGFPCPHKGSCFDDVRKSALRYLSYGYIFGFVKTAVPNIRLILKKPKLLIKYLFAKKVISFGLFAGLYVALYKISSCILCQTQKKDRDIFALPCGTIAGLAFGVLPGSSILGAMLANLIFIYGRKSHLAKSKLPMSQLCFALVNAILFHNYAFFNNLSPPFFTNMLNVGTNYRCYQIYQNISDIAVKCPAQPHSH